jgi:hypothetical protein
MAQMSCLIHRELEGKLAIAKSRWAQYAYPQNKHLRGTSDAKARKIAAESKQQMSDLSQKISAHFQQCPLCNSMQEIK